MRDFFHLRLALALYEECPRLADIEGVGRIDLLHVAVILLRCFELVVTDSRSSVDIGFFSV